MRRKTLSPIPRSLLIRAIKELPTPSASEISNKLRAWGITSVSDMVVGRSLTHYGFTQIIIKTGGKTKRVWCDPSGDATPALKTATIESYEARLAKTLSDPRLIELDSTGRLLGTNSAQVRRLLQPILPPNLRIASIMKALGYLNKPTRDQGGVCRRWLK